MAARVPYGFLRYSEEGPADFVRQVEWLDRQLEAESVATCPDGNALLDRRVEAQLVERIRAETDDLLPEHRDVALRDDPCLGQPLTGTLAIPACGGLLDGGKDQVEAHELLHRAVVDRLGEPPPDLRLGL